MDEVKDTERLLDLKPSMCDLKRTQLLITAYWPSISILHSDQYHLIFYPKLRDVEHAAINALVDHVAWDDREKTWHIEALVRLCHWVVACTEYIQVYSWGSILYKTGWEARTDLERDHLRLFQWPIEGDEVWEMIWNFWNDADKARELMKQSDFQLLHAEYGPLTTFEKGLLDLGN